MTSSDRVAVLARREHARPSVALIVFTGLLAMTVAVSYLLLGVVGLAVALVVVGAKAALVALFFMHLKLSTPLTRLFAGAGLVWLALLLGLTMIDHLTRERADVPFRGETETPRVTE